MKLIQMLGERRRNRVQVPDDAPVVDPTDTDDVTVRNRKGHPENIEVDPLTKEQERTFNERS